MTTPAEDQATKARREREASEAAARRDDYARALREELDGVERRASTGDEHAKGRAKAIRAELSRIGAKVKGRSEDELVATSGPGTVPPPPENSAPDGNLSTPVTDPAAQQSPPEEPVDPAAAKAAENQGKTPPAKAAKTAPAKTTASAKSTTK